MNGAESKITMKYPLEELKRLQAMPLADKIALAKLRIQEWYEHWDGNVCVNYSGGKDSTVLLHLVRDMYPEVPAMYCDHGMDLKSVRHFVLQTPNVIKVKPEMNFRQVIEKYGWVYPSKAVAHCLAAAKRGAAYALANLNGKRLDGTPSSFMQDRYAKWKYLLNAPFKISDMCCRVMKERPLDKFLKETKKKSYVGLLASESQRRIYRWRRYGCNAFEIKNGTSCPLSVWTDQDILRYIKEEGLPIAESYGKIVKAEGKLKTTGESRTGCIFCLIGAHLQKVNRIQRLKELEPDRYRYCLETLGLKEVMQWLKIPY